MNTGELVKELAKRRKISQREARWLLQRYIASITDHLAHGRRVVLQGFGSFDVKWSRAHEGYLPSAGKKMLIPAKRSPQFRPSDKTKQRVKDWEGS